MKRTDGASNTEWRAQEVETTSLLYFISFILPTVKTVHLTAFSSHQAFIPTLRLKKGHSVVPPVTTIIEETESVYVQKFHCLINGEFLESLANKREATCTYLASGFLDQSVYYCFKL